MKVFGLILIIILLYEIIFGAIIFSFNKDVSTEYIQTHSEERFYSNNIGVDRAKVVDTPKEASTAKLNIIKNAKKTLDISYYAVENGFSSKAFWALIIEAADRGVKVRVILDGVSNGMKPKQKEVIYALYKHENIDLKFYEPIGVLSLLTPWVINNRLHDKYIISDNTLAIVGGRNIGDRFWAPEEYKGKLTFDRDIIIYNQNRDKSSGVAELSKYFDEIYNSKYSKDSIVRLSGKKEQIAIDKVNELRESANKVNKTYKQYFKEDINWKEVTYETNKVTLIHNKIERFNKEPWVWYEISRLMKSAKKKVFIQSPYIVLNKKVIKDIVTPEEKNNVDVTILTNSKSSTPNIPAYSSYLNYRDRIIKSGAKIYEYMSNNSIHAKSYGIDDDLTIVGSFNLDPRSVFLSTETMVVVHSKEVKSQFDSIINLYTKDSLLVGEDGEYMVSDNDIEELPISKFKEVLLRIVGVFSRLVEYLL